MATAPPKQDPRTVVRTTERLWSDEVGRAEAETVVRPKDPAYQFSSGRTFYEENPYGWARDQQ